MKRYFGIVLLLIAVPFGIIAAATGIYGFVLVADTGVAVESLGLGFKEQGVRYLIALVSFAVTFVSWVATRFLWRRGRLMTGWVSPITLGEDVRSWLKQRADDFSNALKRVFKV